MKTVFSNTDEVIHVYAQQTQTEGRNQTRSIFFESNKIYSYGYHYLLGEFINDGKAIIIDDEGYSVTTSQHISKLIGATCQFEQFYVSNIDIDKVSDSVNYLLKKLSVARKPEKYISAIYRYFDMLNNWIDYAKENKIVNRYIFKKSSSKYIAIKNLVQKLQSENTEYLSVLKETEKKRKQKEKRQIAKKLKIQLEKFYTYDSNWFKLGEFDYLRLSKDSTKVETSQGVKIDVKEAKKLYLAIQNKIDIVGYKLGYYTINSINSKRLKAGCHNICIKSVNQIGQKLLTL